MLTDDRAANERLRYVRCRAATTRYGRLHGALESMRVRIHSRLDSHLVNQGSTLERIRP